MNMLGSIGLFGGSFGSSEIILILFVALILFGSKNLPNIARNLGKAMEEFRRAARQVTDEIMHADEDEIPKPKSLIAPKPEEKDKSDANGG